MSPRPADKVNVMQVIGAWANYEFHDSNSRARHISSIMLWVN